MLPNMSRAMQLPRCLGVPCPGALEAGCRGWGRMRAGPCKMLSLERR